MQMVRRSLGHLLVAVFALGTLMTYGQAPAQAADELTLENALSFEAVKANWTRRSKAGSLAASFEVQVLETYPNDGPQLVFPKPGDLLVYENTGTAGHKGRAPGEENTNKSGRVVVIDAVTKQIIASNEMPKELSGSVHSTSVSPDGKWVYMTGPTLADGDKARHTMLKIDALTLQPVALLDVGTRIHHGQVWQDKLMVFESFSTRTNPGGLDIFIYDPETDKILGGLRTTDMGGITYTAWADPKNEFLYTPVTPTPLGNPADLQRSAYRTSHMVKETGLRWIPQPFWIAKIDPKTWTVVREYPYPAIRSDWVQFSADGKSFYVDGSTDDKVVKMDVETGDMIWGQATGPGPYAVEVNAEDTEVWTADKGEAVGQFGRTITVVGTEKGELIATLPSAYQVDHVLLSPDGKEMWLTSNGQGKILVFDAASKERIATIDLPGFGDAHGLVFVHYGADGKGRVVADQADFHNGVDPRNGKPLRIGYQVGG